jgi:protein phosphatase 2C family protein 2/3
MPPTPTRVSSGNTINRDYNEDRVSIIYNIQKPHTFPADKKWPIVSYYSLFDGHGGSECANYLRENLQQFVYPINRLSMT